MPWTRCEDCIYQSTCDWPDQLYGSCELGTPKPEEVELLKREKENVMDAIDEIILKQFIGDVSHMSAQMADIGTMMSDDIECEESYKLGVQLLQITNILAKYVLEAITLVNNNETPKELLEQFNKLKTKWPEVYPGEQFFYEAGEE